jgi:hypothetical protein
METQDDYLERLHEIGMEHLGNGVYADVFQHPYYKNVVVRVFTEYDFGYLNFMKFVSKNRNNRYVPQIIPNEQGKLFYKTEFKHPDRPNGKYRGYFVFMKKYIPMTIQQVEHQAKQWGVKDITNTAAFWSLGGSTWAKLSESPKLLQRFGPDAVELARFFATMENRLDIHHDNVMWDADRNNIIFTDPFN